jgi:hypothetical protein
MLHICFGLCVCWFSVRWDRKRKRETLSREHTNARKAYMYAFALLARVGDLRLMVSRIRLCEVGSRIHEVKRLKMRETNAYLRKKGPV